MPIIIQKTFANWGSQRRYHQDQTDSEIPNLEDEAKILKGKRCCEPAKSEEVARAAAGKRT